MSIEADRKFFGGKKQERIPVSPLADIKKLLSKTLLKEGFAFPEGISPNQKNLIPKEWLIRSEPAENLRRPDYRMRPQSGEYASFGVFLADAFQALPTSESSAFYLFSRDRLASNWLVMGSKEWNGRFRKECKDLGVNPQTISGAVSAERRIYETFPTYNPGRGICTVPNEVPVAAATRIYLPARLDYLAESVKPAGCQVSLLSA